MSVLNLNDGGTMSRTEFEAALPSRSAPKRQYFELPATRAATHQWLPSLTGRLNENLHGSQLNSTTVNPSPEMSVDSGKEDPSGANSKLERRHRAPHATTEAFAEAGS